MKISGMNEKTSFVKLCNSSHQVTEVFVQLEQAKGQPLLPRSTANGFKEKCDEGLQRWSSIFNVVHMEGAQGTLKGSA